MLQVHATLWCQLTNSRNASGFPVDYPFPDKDNNYCIFVVLIRLPLTEV